MENQESSMLQVTKVSEVAVDKNGRNYKRISVKPLAGTRIDPVTGEINPVIDLTAREVSFNQYEESYLDGSKDPAYNAPVGTLIPGKIISKSVEEYSFINAEGDEVTASSYTTAVFGDDTDKELFHNNILAAFRRAGHQLPEDSFVAPENQDIKMDEVPEETEA